MARKRLSDLLREEAQKPAEGDSTENSPTAAPDAAAAKGKSPRTSAKASRAVSTASTAGRAKTAGAGIEPKPRTPAAAKPKAEPAAPAATAEVTPEAAPAAAAETAALTDQLADVQSQVTAAQRREDLLKRQILDLETALESEQARSQQLQSELDQVRLKSRPLVSLPSHAATPSASAPASVQRTAHPVSTLEAELENILRHPTLPDQPYVDLTNEDIGWMD